MTYLNHLALIFIPYPEHQLCLYKYLYWEDVSRKEATSSLERLVFRGCENGIDFTVA